FLPRSGVEQLFSLVRQCTKSGARVIFVSHDIDEVRTITDRATILRDGKLAGTVATADTSHDRFVELIVGRSLDPSTRRTTPQPGSDSRVTVDGLSGGGAPLSMTVAKGEIVGLTGLIGSGFDHVPAQLYGARLGTTGRLVVDGEPFDLARLTPERALGAGIAYVPGDRMGEGAVGALPVADNVSLPVLQRLKSRFGLTSGGLRRHALSLGADAGVKPNDPSLPLSALSGGNAQKAVLAKWLQTKPRLLLLDEPTQGVEVGARQTIWAALGAASDGGSTILIASTDYEQLAAICHRVLIFAGGRVVAELTGGALTKDAIAEAAFGANRRAA
ncbi:MAG: ATP-binding cassette domain-containing protein, partial [Pseudomonadota bacterium]